jgi:hypothetical protein
MPIAFLVLVSFLCSYVFLYMLTRNRAPTVSDIGHGDDEGFVWKRGRWFGAWKKRYLIKKGNVVHCFEADEAVCNQYLSLLSLLPFELYVLSKI